MNMLPKENFIYAFNKDHKPVLTVSPGSQIVIETHDCYQGQIQSEDSGFQSVDWNQINPATGPVFIEGAKAGDILKVQIDKIEINDHGVMTVEPGLGVMGHRMEEFVAKMIPIVDKKAIFNEKLELPLNPMIGVIGVAPDGEPVSCGTPGAHGGNMDTTLIEPGATLYLPIFQEGALFALGDLHAAMGDGEISVTGIEIAGKVTVTLDVLKGQSIQYPFVKNQQGIAAIVSAETLDEAAKRSVEVTIDTLLPHMDLTLAEMTMLMSAVGNVQVSQIVDPLVTARFFVPRSVLEAYKVSLSHS